MTPAVIGTENNKNSGVYTGTGSKALGNNQTLPPQRYRPDRNVALDTGNEAPRESQTFPGFHNLVDELVSTVTDVGR